MFVAVLTENIEVAEEATKEKHAKNRNSVRELQGEPTQFMNWLRKWNPFKLDVDPNLTHGTPQAKFEKRSPDTEDDDFILRSTTKKWPTVSSPDGIRAVHQ